MKFADWIRGARPKTLPLAVAPVITGAAVASVSGAPYDPRFLAVMLLCMGVALFLQIAANFANDYSDGLRGTDAGRDARCADDIAESQEPDVTDAASVVDTTDASVASDRVDFGKSDSRIGTMQSDAAQTDTHPGAALPDLARADIAQSGPAQPGMPQPCTPLAPASRRNAPTRLVASGVAPRHVLFAAGVNAVLACACGLAVCALTGYWWFIAVGAASLIAGWCYVGGSHPYGYHYLGEVFVFVFFGLVAACGTMFALSGHVTAGGVCAGTANGLVAVAVLCVNNLRDIESDRAHGKHTWMTALDRTWGTVFADALLVAASILAIAQVAGWFVSVPVIIAVCVFMCIVQIAACDAISRVDYRRALPLCTLGSLSVSLVFAAAAFLV